MCICRTAISTIIFKYLEHSVLNLDELGILENKYTWLVEILHAVSDKSVINKFIMWSHSLLDLLSAIIFRKRFYQ